MPSRGSVTVSAPRTRLIANWELIWNLTLRELRTKFNRSSLGFAWSLLNPLVSLGVYAAVFAVFLRVEPPVGRHSGLHNYAFFLVSGLIAWNFVSNAVTGSVHTMIANAGLIQKVAFPRHVLPLATVLSWLVTFLIELGVLLVALAFVGNITLPWLPGVVLVLVLQVGFITGLALALSVLNVYMRDIEHLSALGLNVWFFLTPIVYPIDIIEQNVGGIAAADLLRLNPMTQFVEAYRDLLYHLQYPSPARLAALVAASATSLAVGWAIFRRLEPRLAEEL